MARSTRAHLLPIRSPRYVGSVQELRVDSGTDPSTDNTLALASMASIREGTRLVLQRRYAATIDPVS
jgi:hypothetical protein